MVSNVDQIQVPTVDDQPYSLKHRTPQTQIKLF